MKDIIIENLKYKSNIDDFRKAISYFKIDHLQFSIKITGDKIYDDRLLLAVNKNDYKLSYFIDAIRNITNNEDIINFCKIKFQECDTIMFAYEFHDELNYRIYFEKVVDEKIKYSNFDRFLAITGYKWNKNSSTFLTTCYEYVININDKSIRDYASNVKDKEFANFILTQQRNKNIDAAYFVYDIGGERKSYSLGLVDYKISNLPDNLISLHKKENIMNNLRDFGNFRIGDISFGRDKSNKKFFTMYFNVE